MVAFGLYVEDDAYWSYPVIVNGKNFDESYRRTQSYWYYRDVVNPLPQAHRQHGGVVRLGGGMKSQ